MTENKQEHSLLPEVGTLLPTCGIMLGEFEKEIELEITSILVTHLTQSLP